MMLVDFLRARIDEDEVVAKHALNGDLDYMPFITTKHGDVIYLGGDTTRILRECEAKRGIIIHVSSGKEPDREGWYSRRILLYLAQSYTDHPEFLEEWRSLATHIVNNKEK